MVRRRSSRLLVLVGLLVVLGALVRLPLLAARPLWFDECSTLNTARGPLLETLATSDRMPPAHALVVRAMLAFGDDEWLLRFPSFVAGVASIAVAFVAGRRWSSARAGLVLAALVAFSPPLVFYAREARPYSLGVFAILALLVAAKGRSALALALASFACVATLWTGAVVVFFVHLAVARRDRRTLLSAIGTALLVAPLLPLLHAQLAAKSAGGGFLEGAFYAPASVASFARVHVPALASWLVSGSAHEPATAALVAVAIALGAFSGARRALVGLGPAVAVFFLAGVHVHPFGAIRHALPLAPGLFLVAAAGLDALGRRAKVAAAFLAALLVFLAAHGLPAQRLWYVEDLPGVLASVRAELRPGDTLYVEAWSRPPFAYYTRREAWPGRVVTRTEWLDGRALGEDVERSFEGGERLWLVSGEERDGAVLRAERLLAERFVKRATVERLRAHATLWTRR